MRRFRCVDDQKAAGFPVSAACRAAGVSTSGYFAWCSRVAAGPTEREVAEAELVELMREIFDASDGNYGVPRMYKELRRGGLGVNEKRLPAPDAAPRHGGAVPATAVPHHVPRTRRLRHPGSGGATFRSRPTRCRLGAGHHLHSHRRGLVTLYLASVLDLRSRLA